jgi:hypothetical protein
VSRRLLVAALLLVAARRGLAQRYGDPSGWLSGGVSLWQSQGIDDPKTNGFWDLSVAPQYRAALEFPMGYGTALGVAGTYATVPLTFRATGPAACGTCDANITVTQVLGLLHIGGGGEGVHQVIEVEAGVTSFAGLKATDGTSLGLDHPATDLTFLLGYGFGISLSRSMELSIVEDLGTIVHARASDATGGTNAPRQYITRLGLRYAFGGPR